VNRLSPAPTDSAFQACAGAFEAELDYVYRTMRRLGARPAEAEDLAQDVFLVVWRRWGDLQANRPLRPWLTGVAHHVARDYFRRHARREVATAEIDLTDEAPGPEDQLSSARARHLALTALALLPERDRAILVRYEFDGRSIREMAEESSLPLFTVAARLRRARARFAKVIHQLQPYADRRGAALSAPAVLALERALPGMPELARARVLRRIRRLDGGPPPQPHPAPGPARWVRVPALGPAGSALLALFVLSALARSSGRSEPAPTPLAIVEGRLPGRSDQPRRSPPPPRLIAVPAPRGSERPPAGPEPGLEPGLRQGLIGHWRFEDGSGSPLARDSSGNRRPCLLHGLDVDRAWVDGAVGGGLDLGRRGWLECPVPEARAGVPLELSAALWIRPVGPRRREAALLSRQLPDGSFRHLFWFGLREGHLAVWSWSWIGWAMAGPPPPPTAWTHVAFVHSRGESRLYLDGQLIRHKTSQLPRGQGLVQSALIIGATAFRPDPLKVRHHFDGVVDEVIVHDRALTENEVAALSRSRVHKTHLSSQ
jgi:RNA polymerase sigma-70 factor, ECF subfamily